MNKHTFERLCKTEPDIETALVIGDVTALEADYGLNARRYYMPASCQKVITGFLAYKELGEEFCYKTCVLINKEKPIDLILKFCGDPTLTLENLNDLLSPFRGTDFKGALICDISHFQTPEWSPYWMIEDIASTDAAPLSAAIINKNSVTFTLVPTYIGQHPEIQNLKEVSYECRIIVSDTDDTKLKFSWAEDCLVMEGVLSQREGLIDLTVGADSSQWLLTRRLQKLLKNLNIECGEGINFIKDPQKLPSNAQIQGSYLSPPLRDFLPRAMKTSDNLILDSIYLTLLQQYMPESQEWKDGFQVIQSLALKYLDFHFGLCEMVDGSGLSRFNQMQPEVLWHFLIKIFSDPFCRSYLPKGGEKGSTLEDRFLSHLDLFAKTGTLTGIHGLCGYLHNVSATPKAFVILMSHPSTHEDQALLLQEKIIQVAYAAQI